MRFCFGSLLIFVWVIIQEFKSNAELQMHDLTKHGAVGDGVTDDTQAFVDAWNNVCRGNSTGSTLLFPQNKKFLVHTVQFSGPCSRSIGVKIDGTILAPTDLSKFVYNSEYWIKFISLDGFSIYGSGTIDGRGSVWWNRNCNHKCSSAPAALIIDQSNHVNVSNISVVNSPNVHIVIESSKNITAQNLSIKAPENSTNTDGIHIKSSQGVAVSRSYIGTGDDCISIGPETSDLQITNITCGPGHGISIGSLGKPGEIDHVEDIHIQFIIFNKTSNGARIKTKPGGQGYVRNISFSHVDLIDVRNPIIIDQYYFAKDSMTHGQPALNISNIRYEHFHGTSDDKIAMNFNCSDVVPCTGIVLTDINILKTRLGDNTEVECSNARGISVGEVIPRSPCMKIANEIESPSHP